MYVDVFVLFMAVYMRGCLCRFCTPPALVCIIHLSMFKNDCLQGICKVEHFLFLVCGSVVFQSWTESTDPRKFVYEDISIAAYLIVLWEDELKQQTQSTTTSRKQSFVDLGCGNGLLVYLLTKEGVRIVFFSAAYNTWSLCTLIYAMLS